MAESAEPSLTAAEKVIVTPKNLKSDVWKYFGFWAVDCKLVEPTDKVVCKLCKLALAYHSTTSNLRLHLQNVHPSEYGIICGTSAKQPRLDTYFAPSVTSSLPAARQEACTQKLISFICKDMRPISVVDGIGFREFCEALEPRYRIPCCRSFKPLCAESATVRERQREGERKSACVRARGQALRSWPLVNLLIFV